MNEKYLVKEKPILHESGAKLGTSKSYSIPICDKDNCKELQSYKQKEDKIRELIEAPIDNMSLNWQSKLILAILNEGE